MVRRPWGIYLVLAHKPTWWLKILIVWGRTSLQKHSHRDELLIGTRGITYVPRETFHRTSRGVYVEYAWGEPTEADCYRIEDDYQRI